jgi:hypothetical protein
MYNLSVDLHKETSWFHIVDAHGRKVNSKNISNKPAILKQYFEQNPRPFVLAVKVTYKLIWLNNTLISGGWAKLS